MIMVDESFTLIQYLTKFRIFLRNSVYPVMKDILLGNIIYNTNATGCVDTSNNQFVIYTSNFDNLYDNIDDSFLNFFSRKDVADIVTKPQVNMGGVYQHILYDKGARLMMYNTGIIEQNNSFYVWL